MIKFGQSTINDIYFRNTNVNKVYFGSTLIFEKENIRQVLYEFTKGSETIYNTIEDSVKSAILKGQTLVNLMSGHELTNVGHVFTTYENGIYTYQSREGYNGNIFPANILSINTPYKLELNKTYTLFITYMGNDGCQFGLDSLTITQNGNTTIERFVETTVNSNHIHKLKFTLTQEFDVIRLRLNAYDSTERSLQFKNIMVLEGDHTNADIPYFEGMRSVKMPVLTTTGKNTLNPNEITFDSSSAANPESYTYSEGVYTFKNSRSNNQMRFTITKQNASDKILYEVLEVKDLNGNVIPHQIVMEGSNDKAYWFSIIRPDWKNVGEVKIKLGVDSLEPYKSNILTVNEDVTLRSNGDICDELNLLTGQLTQRIGEDGNILDQEIVRTVNLIITDQDGNNVSTLKTFNDITHIIVKSNTNVLPTVKIGVAFNSNSVQAVSDAQNTISSEQYNIEEKINNQSQETETAMIGVTEVYEQQV